jgi:hypothetical protein
VDSLGFSEGSIKSTEEDLWSISRKNDLNNDDDIIEFWQYASQSNFDIIHETDKNKYKCGMTPIT